MTFGPAALAREAAASLGVARLPAWKVHELAGRDVLDLVQRISTADVRGLTAGSARTTLFLSPNGRIVHRVLLLAGEDRLLAIAEPSPSSFPGWIDRFTFGEDVRVAPGGEALLIVGPGAAGRVAVAEGATVSAGEDLLASRRDLGPVPSCLLAGSRPALDAFAENLARSGAVILDEPARQELRVACGVPEGGAELTEDYHPLEAGLASEISFTKGCYVGQEVVARQETYGKVTRRLVGLLLDRAPAPGDALGDESAKGCRVTSAAPEPLHEGGGIPCLGYVRARESEPGRAVVTASGAAGRIVPLPHPLSERAAPHA